MYDSYRTCRWAKTKIAKQWRFLFLHAGAFVTKRFNDFFDAVGNARHHGNVSIELSAHGNNGILETYDTISHFINQAVNALHEECRLIKYEAKEQRKPQHAERKNDIENVEIFEHKNFT